MIFNSTGITTVVSKLNSTIVGWFCGEQSLSRKDAASVQQHQGNQAVGLFGLLVSGDISNRH